MTTLSEIEPGNFKATLTWMCGNQRGTFPLIQDGLFLKRYHEAAQREEGFQKRVRERKGERSVQREKDICNLKTNYQRLSQSYIELVREIEFHSLLSLDFGY